MKRTKIVATIGPVSDSKSMIKRMAKAGMNVCRLNFSHGTHEHHAMLVRNIRKASEELDKPLGIIQDLQGPRIRIGELPPDGVQVKRGEEVILVPESQSVPAKSDIVFIPIQYTSLYKDLKKRDPVLIDDAAIELEVVSIKDKKIKCKVIVSGIIKTHKGMNFPESRISCPPVTEKDMEDVEFGVKNHVDYVAMSFVENAKDIKGLRRKIASLERKYNNKESKDRLKKKIASKGKTHGIHTRIIAKIERREAVDNFDSILKEVDAIMVARGDLGIEIPFEDLPLIQKDLIDKCRKAGKPVIVATQMLDSMIRNPLPTRAEVSDVANAILDGTDAIMLSGETASGKYPLKAIGAMNRIAHEVEDKEIEEQEMKENDFKSSESVSHIMSFVAQDLAEDVADAKIIVCATTSGFTARNISSFRSKVPIVAVAPVEKTVNQLCLSWGVSPYLVPFTSSFNSLTKRIKTVLMDNKLVTTGDKIVLVAGHPFGYKGKTNLIKVEII